MKNGFLRFIGNAALALLMAGSASAAVVYTPMIDHFGDTIAPNTDEWFATVDASGTVAVQVYEAFGSGTIRLIQGSSTSASATAGGTDTTISLGGLTPGSTVKFEHEHGAAPSVGPGDVQHYRPRFSGVDQVWIEETQKSPNDLVNYPDGSTRPFGSNIELGFDDRFDTLPGTFIPPGTTSSTPATR